MSSRVITTNEALAEFCASFAQEEFITVDTEFIRERTYFPNLCLMQVGTSREAVAIDPIAGAQMDLTPLYRAFADARLMKVFHAAKQDIEIFVHDSGRVPEPLYDTQIAAMVCGYGESISYENLVRDLVGASLDKASRFTDWARRPLSDRQLNYALDDVIHLREVYKKLKSRIEAESRAPWIEEEMARLADITQYRVNAQDAWRRLKVKSRSPEALQILREVAAWREERAAQRNLPRQRVLRDEIVVQIAGAMPESVEDLLQVRGLAGQVSRESLEALVERIHQARLAPKESFPQPEPREKPMPAAQEACLDQLRLLLRQCAEDAHVVPRLVADRDLLEDIVRGRVALSDTVIGQGWRYEVFGRAAAALLTGQSQASVQPFRGGFGLVWQGKGDSTEPPGNSQ